MNKFNLIIFAFYFMGFFSQPMLGQERLDQESNTWLMNGEPVPAHTFKEVFWVNWGGYHCTSTLIGPRVILTAGHCSKPRETMSFTVKDKHYAASYFASPLYKPDELEKDHDIAVGIVDEVVEGIKPATVSSKATIGRDLLLLGFGCLYPNGAGGNDGILRMGYSKVAELEDYVMISRYDNNGAVLCFGDSGGPTYVIENGKRVLLGVHSATNLKDTNFDTRADVRATKEFLVNIAEDYNVEICGVNATCESLEANE